jgi:hypothetical protein
MLAHACHHSYARSINRRMTVVQVSLNINMIIHPKNEKSKNVWGLKWKHKSPEFKPQYCVKN